MSGLSRAARIEYIIDQFGRWLHTDELTHVIALFTQEKIPCDMDTVSYIRWLKEFVQIWDYRRMQTEARTAEGENARWLIRSSDYLREHENEIVSAANELGMVSCDHSDMDADYILPLGGTVVSNYMRNIQAKKSRDEGKTVPYIVCLSTLRKLSESEMENREYTAYAEGCDYEFESMCRAAENVYDLGEGYQDTRCDEANPDASWVIRRYDKDYKGSQVTVLAAPSSDPQHRRANSADCFEFFFNRLDVPEGSRLLNATGSIYCAYQQVRALHYAINHGVIFDTVGYRTDKEPVNYLQEIKATVDAMYDFVTEFVYE